MTRPELRTSLELGIGPNGGEHNPTLSLVKSAGDEKTAKSDDLARAARGSAINNRLVPAPDRGPGFRRDPETGFFYYSAAWL